jgi:hypothetical protein
MRFFRIKSLSTGVWRQIVKLKYRVIVCTDDVWRNITDEPWANSRLSFFYHGRDSITLTYLDNFIRSAVEKILVLVASWPGLIRYSLQELVWWRSVETGGVCSDETGDVQLWLVTFEAGDVQWSWWCSDFASFYVFARDVQIILETFSWSWWRSVDLVTFSWIWRRSAEAGDVQINFFLHLLYLLWSLSLRWLPWRATRGVSTSR